MNNVHEFIALHGGNPVADGVYERLLPDGAGYIEASNSAFTTFRDPPTNPTDLLRFKKRYLELRIGVLDNAFQRLKAEYIEMANWSAVNPSMAAPPPDAVQQLEQRGACIRELQDRLAVILIELAKTPEEISRVQREEQKRHAKARLEDLAKAINAVTY